MTAAPKVKLWPYPLDWVLVGMIMSCIGTSAVYAIDRNVPSMTLAVVSALLLVQIEFLLVVVRMYQLMSSIAKDVSSTPSATAKAVMSELRPPI